MFRLPKFLFIVMAAMTSAITTQANAVENDTAKTQLLIDKFKEVCEHTPLDLDSLSAKAATMNLRPLEPPAEQLPADKSIKQKTWSIAEREGFVLAVQEGGDPYEVTCAVVGKIFDFDALHAEFVKEVDSTPAPTERVSENKKVYRGKYPAPYTVMHISGTKESSDWFSAIALHQLKQK